MSLFGDGTFKQEVFDSLHYIIHNFNTVVEEANEQIQFLLENIFHIVNGEHSKVNKFFALCQRTKYDIW